ncbi:DUF4238 domain-containing protein [Raoultella ornithinolytica]|uniref:DUF4238 domain-containing protein n=2 Tax=Raoultella ornithinolytica TaxID=54291 RepID=UPI001F23BB70|nr:DUF4238 domain-containing protein [Raoultella ornithinolytica]MCE9813917.1 DUF4238 domain-containing protein [Raoultella ornithinolytica]
MSVQRQSKNHHYIPKCYLRSFSPDSSDSVFYIDLIGKEKKDPNIPKYIPPKACALRNVEKFGFEVHRNTVLDLETERNDTRLIEDLFGKVEEIYPEIMECIHNVIIDGSSINEVDDDDLIRMINILCSIMLSRLPTVDARFMNLNNELHECMDYLNEHGEILYHYMGDSESFSPLLVDENVLELAEFLSADADADADAIRDLISKSVVKLVKRAASFMPILNEMEMVGFKTYILKSDSSLPFITGDFPFVINGDKNTLSNGFIFVLSPSLALCRLINPLKDFNSLSFARYVNDEIRSSAKRFLISNNKDVLDEVIMEWHLDNPLS